MADKKPFVMDGGVLKQILSTDTLAVPGVNVVPGAGAVKGYRMWGGEPASSMYADASIDGVYGDLNYDFNTGNAAFEPYQYAWRFDGDEALTLANYGGGNYYFNLNGDAHIQGNLQVNYTTDLWGYTRLGAGAPRICMKKLTGTTAATEGGTVLVAHGLTASKILDVSVLVTATNGVRRPPGAAATGYQYRVFLSADGLYVGVTNHETDSQNTLSRPFTCLITYEQ